MARDFLALGILPKLVDRGLRVCITSCPLAHRVILCISVAQSAIFAAIMSEGASTWPLCMGLCRPGLKCGI
jgi:hypothetical protein